jgi:hypothetical protein
MKKGTDKTYTASKEINGVTYRAQFNGVREAVRATQQFKTDELKLDEYLLENVIVEPPGLELDDFDDLAEAREVINFAASVMMGRFRNSSDEATAEGDSEK